MVPPPTFFRLVYRSFDHIVFDHDKNDEVYAAQGFDLEHASKVFPGYVLERQDTRYTREARNQVIGEVFGMSCLSCIP
jgi:uncharacterized DUF497 family protein